MSTKSRILHVIPRGEYGGIEKVVDNLHALIDNTQFDSHICAVLTCNCPDIHAEYVIRCPVTILLPLTLIRVAAEIRKLIRLLKPDIVHFHAEGFFTVLQALSTYGLPCNKVFTVHSIRNHGSSLKLTQRLAIACERFNILVARPNLTAVSQSAADVYQMVVARNKTITVIHNGVTVPPDITNQRMPLPNARPGSLILITHMRLDANKGAQFIIPAVSRLLAEKADIHLFVVGEGYYRGYLEFLVKKYDVERNVTFLGFRDDVQEILQSADIGIIASITEGFGLTLIEQMAGGLPVVCSDIPAFREIAGDNEVEFFQVGNFDELTTKLRKLINDASERKRLGRQGRELVRERFDVNHQVVRFEELYKKILAE